MERPLGTLQLDALLEFYELAGRRMHRTIPPHVYKQIPSLIDRGLIWSRFDTPHECALIGLTDEGRRAAALEKQRRELAK